MLHPCVRTVRWSNKIVFLSYYFQSDRSVRAGGGDTNDLAHFASLIRVLKLDRASVRFKIKYCI